MRSFAKTDIGKLRDINQDYYYISDNLGLYILADRNGWIYRRRDCKQIGNRSGSKLYYK